MRNVITLLLTLGFLGVFGASAIAKEPVIKEKKHGIYEQRVEFSGIRIMYLVDTKAQLCFAHFEGTVSIDCASLKKRTGWESIITWVN